MLITDTIKQKKPSVRKWTVLFGTHGACIVIGFALGIFMLPIITAPPSPEAAVLEEMATEARYSADLSRDQRGNDFLHWGEGTISLSATQIIHQGKMAPGPNYKLYLLKEYVEHEEEFLPLKDTAVVIGDVRTFEGFVVEVPTHVNISEYNTVLVWCEAFSEFITSAKYK